MTFILFKQIATMILVICPAMLLYFAIEGYIKKLGWDYIILQLYLFIATSFFWFFSFASAFNLWEK